MEAKHESNSVWLQSLQTIMLVLKNEFFNHLEKFGMRWENLVEFLLLQTKMNLQDEIDKDTLSLVGLKSGKD